MARHDAISPECDKLICEMLLAGESTRHVALTVGCSDKTVEFRRARLHKLGARFPDCECGRPINHRGTCKWKVARFRANPNPKRGSEPRVKVNPWQYVVAEAGRVPLPKNKTPKKIIEYVQRIVPRRLDTRVREDVVQDMYLMIFGKEIPIEKAFTRMPELISKNYEIAFGRPGRISFNYTDKDGDFEINLHEVLPGEVFGGRYVSSLQAAMENSWAGFFEESSVDEGGSAEYI